MDYIGWDDMPAPTLNTINLTRVEAGRVFNQVLHNIEIMLTHHRIHGDLSTYNILYFEGDIYLIDFPQVIDPAVNRNAYAIFQRDLMRLCDYFQMQGVNCNPQDLAKDLWVKNGFQISQYVDPRLLPPEDVNGI